MVFQQLVAAVTCAGVRGDPAFDLPARLCSPRSMTIEPDGAPTPTMLGVTNRRARPLKWRLMGVERVEGQVKSRDVV